nr:unnamed protein product [Spirometra erinaceieuropaei]
MWHSKEYVARTCGAGGLGDAIADHRGGHDGCADGSRQPAAGSRMRHQVQQQQQQQHQRQQQRQRQLRGAVRWVCSRLREVTYRMNQIPLCR